MRWIWSRSSSWRRWRLEAPQPVAGKLGRSPRASPSRGRPAAPSAAPSARRMRCTSTPITPEPSPWRPKAAIASRARSRMAASSPWRIAAAIRSRSWTRSISAGAVGRRLARRRAPSPALAPRAPPRPRRAEEEAVEDELEHAPVLGRLGQRGGQRLAHVPAPRPRDLAQRRERVEQLRGPDRDALSAQLLAELEERASRPAAGSRAAGASAGPPSRTPTRSATTSRSVRCLTMMLIVERKRSASMSSAPSRSRARAQSIDSAIDGGFLRSRSRTMCTISTSRRDGSRTARACADARSRARARDRGSRATDTGSGA